MRFLLSHLSVAALMLVATRCASATPTDFEGWFTTTTLTALDEDRRYQFYLELQPRLGDDWHRMALVVVRPALVYSPKKNLSLFAGYAWVPKFYNQQYHHDYRDEQRLWEQLLYKHSSIGIAWHHRLRQEQRMLAEAHGVSNRSRYLIRGSYPLIEGNPVGLTGYSETLVNLNGVKGGLRVDSSKTDFSLVRSGSLTGPDTSSDTLGNTIGNLAMIAVGLMQSLC